MRLSPLVAHAQYAYFRGIYAPARAIRVARDVWHSRFWRFDLATLFSRFDLILIVFASIQCQQCSYYTIKDKELYNVNI